MKIAANVHESMVRLWMIPKNMHETIKEAYANREWLWLVSIWNEHQVTIKKICAGCPDSIDVVKTFIPDLWK